MDILPSAPASDSDPVFEWQKHSHGGRPAFFLYRPPSPVPLECVYQVQRGPFVAWKLLMQYTFYPERGRLFATAEEAMQMVDQWRRDEDERMRPIRERVDRMTPRELAMVFLHALSGLPLEGDAQ